MKQYTLKDLWGMVNRIAVSNPAETLKRCDLAEQFLVKADCPDLMEEDWRGNIPFDEMTETIIRVRAEACRAI